MLAQHRASPPQKVCFYGRPARASRGRDRPKAGRLTGAFQIRYVSRRRRPWPALGRPGPGNP
ncbi:hypothetical protein C7S16_6078 [Burkholderia thailandensis]|uniref:Uncharacterized protein n=1 Tax=Burkholderia thailandensis TaxID=57975 RepID=A0AAW9CNY9_BURTH|nr:hypothetical protein [Burkholderia thailandensis]MDW9250873.1 hypothetical protein [Burkholderia thailandensis]